MTLSKVQDLAGFKKEKKKTKMERSYRETTKLVGHAAVRCERELSESRGEEVSLPQCWVNLKSRRFSLDKHPAV